MANNLRGLTEEEAERAASQAIVTRYGVTSETVTDVLRAKKELLRHSGMLEFIDASENGAPENLAGVGGLDNLKSWLAQRRGTWEDAAREFGLEPPRGAIILGVQGCGKSMCARAIAGEWKLPLVKFDTAAIYDKYIDFIKGLPNILAGSLQERQGAADGQPVSRLPLSPLALYRAAGNARGRNWRESCAARWRSLSRIRSFTRNSKNA